MYTIRLRLCGGGMHFFPHPSRGMGSSQRSREERGCLIAGKGVALNTSEQLKGKSRQMKSLQLGGRS